PPEEEAPAPSDATEAAVVPEDGSEPARDAADVFARLRAETEAAVAPADAAVAEAAEDDAAQPAADDADSAEATSEPEPSPTAAAFQARAEALEPVTRDLGRRLKRTLADEQNEVLDLLRRAKPKGVDDVLPSA